MSSFLSIHDSNTISNKSQILLETTSTTSAHNQQQYPQLMGEQTHERTGFVNNNAQNHLSIATTTTTTTTTTSTTSTSTTTTTPATTTILSNAVIETSTHAFAAKEAETTGVTSAQQRAGLSALGTISSETLDALQSHPDDRIWDYIIVAEGYEGLQSAHQLALMHPTRTVLVLVQQDIQPNVVQTVVEWSQRRLSEQAQKLWSLEALQAITTDAHTQQAAQSSTIAGSLLHKPEDVQSPPLNVSVGSGLCVNRILIDKPIGSLQSLDSTVEAEADISSTLTTPHHAMRLNSSGGSQRNILTINTTSLEVPRAVGLEASSIHDPNGCCQQLFCKSSIIFANHKHPLLQLLDTTTTPHTSSTWRRISDTIDDPTRWARMVFTIRMQYFQQAQSSQQHHDHIYRPFSPNAFRHLLASTSSMLEKLTQISSDKDSNTMHIKGLKLEPILLHQSDCTVQNGRVGPKTDDSEVEDVFTLEISASRTSLDVSTPIQIQINVISQPMPNNTFGNTEAISNGEAILIEGLVMARSMARRAGWTCQEEDESEMIEWVRDQMDIQWLSETIADTDVLFPICSTVEGIHRFRRARTFSNGSIRIRTPNLSPYASRTHSYQNKRNEDQRLGLQCDTTISQLHKFSTNIKEHKAIQSEEAGDLPHVNDTNGENDKGLSPRHVEENGASKVSIAAVESNTVKRPLKTSFGGFSSLNESRSQTLALAEMTEDHLGLALSAPSPPARSSSSGSSNNSAAQEKSTGTFGDGISSSDLGAIETTKPSLPPERSLSRFSIKSYQLERNNHGLGDEWALGDVDQFLGSTSTKIDLSTPPLIAERRPSGGISPLSPSPSKFQDIDFLQDLTGRVSPKTHDNVSLQNGSGAVLLESAAVSPNEKPHIENIRRKSFGVFGPRSNSGLSQPNDLGSSGSSDSNRDRKSPAQLLEEPLEFVPDFLGNSFGSPKTSAPATFTDVPDFLGASFRTPKSSPSSTAAKHVPDFLGNTFGSPPKRAFVKLSDTDPSLERNYSSPGAIGSTKVVHFAEVDAADKLRRTDSEPITHVHESGSNGTARRNSGSNEGGDEDSEMLRKSMLNDNSNLLVSPQTSKSKAHTRRSWGQGIGGHDIQGIQGLE